MHEGPLAESEIVVFAQSIAEALQAAHEQQVVHRDLKPGNVMLTRAGGVKVLDFGFAKLDTSRSELLSERLSSMSPAGGTLHYMAPEQILGHEVDGRADLYSLGVVLYQMATGRLPFDSDAPSALCMQILKARPRPPRALNSAISGRLEWVIWKLLQKDPARRYPDAATLLADLAKVDQPMRPVERAQRALLMRHPGRRALTLGMGVAVTVAALALSNVGDWRGHISGRPPIRSLAVLPFTNLSADSTQEFIADGLTEEVIANLAQIPSLRVISRTSTMGYKKAPKPMRVIGRELDVDGVIEGSIGRVGDRLRVTTQLVRAATDEHVWTRSYDRPLSDLSTLRTEVALAIADEIEAKISPGRRAQLARPRPVDPAAYDSFLKGRYYRDRIQLVDLRKAIEYFDDAIRRQPDFARAYADQADCYLQLGLFNGMPTVAAYDRARELARHAVALDSTCVEGQVMLGRLLMVADWKFPEAESHLRTALRLSPGHAGALRAMANYLSVMGHPQEAVAHSQRAREIDPLSIRTNQGLTQLLINAGRYDDGIRQGYRTLELDSTWMDVHFSLEIAYHAKGMIHEAIQEQLLLYDYLSSIQFVSAEPEKVARLRAAYARGGPEAFYRADIERMRDGYAQENPCAIASLYCYLDEPDSAMAWLELAYAKRYQALLYVRADPTFAKLRSDPRFLDLMRRMRVAS
jgi:TolB-like protein